MSVRSQHLADYLKAQEQLAELQATFDLRWRADMRAISRWQDAHPDRKLTWPDHADLVVWLIGELERLDAAREALAGEGGG